MSASASTRIYAFVAVNPDSTTATIDVLQIIIKLKDAVENLHEIVVSAVDKYLSLLSDYSQDLISTVIETAQSMRSLIGDIIGALANFQFSQLPTLLNKFDSLWTEGWTRLKGNTTLFLDSVRNNTRILKYNITTTIENAKNDIEKYVHNTISKLTDDLKSTLANPDGLGFRFQGGFNLKGLKIIGLEIEMVYSIDALAQCSKLKMAYEHLQDEKAVRVYGGFSTGLLKYIKIHPVMKLIEDAGLGIGLAISLESNGKFAAQLHIEVKIIGIKGEVDLLVTNQGVYFYIEGNAWDLFKVQIKVYAEHAGSWELLTLGVQGHFLADGDGDGVFQDSYLSAMRRYIQRIADDAEKRISNVQDTLTKAQKGMSKAQNWLESKKADVKKANAAFDTAIQKLENVKEKLEKAKEPFKKAVDKLNAAQDKVNKLCKIKTCKKICVPGLKCKICKKKIGWVKIPYPCCKFTKCMISFPNPLCVAANVLCRILRAAAYAALEIAKFLVKAPMVALDLAKAAVSAAQFVVDKARIVLDIAIAALDLAKLGLEAAKKTLDIAKAALEAVKKVVQLGFKALQFIIQFGIQSIIDVRNCGFEVQISTHDLSVFDIHCEVNAFRLGWRKIGIRINFTDIVQSIWNAAKATIEAILKTVGNIFSGRKRRELQHQTIYTLYKFLRQPRDIDGDLSETVINDTLNVVSQIIGFQGDPDGGEYEYRTNVFKVKCQDFENMINFLFTAVQALHNISFETATTFENETNIIEELDSFETNSTFHNLSMNEVGINPQATESEFNISLTELNDMFEEGKANLSNDEYLNDVRSFTYEAKEILKNQTEDANNVQILNQWVAGMDNLTTDFFDPELCALFLDCMNYAMTVLYELYIDSDIPTKQESLDSVSEFENIFLNLTSDFSLPIVDVNALAVELENKLILIESFNMFCLIPPTMMKPLENQTLGVGQILSMVCNATADPKPVFLWYKDDELMPGYDDMELRLSNVTENDTGWYSCTAGNIVANLTFDAAFVNVTGNLFCRKN